MVYGPGLRLDKWLWFARLTRTRSQAQELAESRHLRLDGRVIERASALVRPGSVLSFPWNDEVRVVRGLFAGQLGTVQEVDPRGGLRLLVGKRTVKLDAADVERRA